MKFTIKQGDFAKQNHSCLVMPITEKGSLPVISKKLDKNTQKTLAHLLKQGDIQGKTGQTWLLPCQPGAALSHVLIIGCGKSLTVTERDYAKLVMASVKTLQNNNIRLLLTSLPSLTIENRDTAWKVKFLVETAATALYRFDHYKSVKSPETQLKEIQILLESKKDIAASTQALKQGIAIADGMAFTKDLGNQPSNICTPTYVAEQAKKFAREYKNIKIKVLEESDMRKLGMGAFLSVTKGTTQPAKMVILEYKGTAKKQAPIALVGKGVTFDTGGISLKPTDGMVGMKYDMCGAATVLGTFKAAAELKLPIHLVGVLALAENMPDGNASKPEDIVTTMSGQTVEILNTDAEGRLVLSDALTYTERYNPAVVIDIATLTGAVVVALGHHATGLLANNDKLAEDLLAAGTESYDRAWRMPLWEEYQEQIRSPFADMANTGGRMGGTITAACFLSRYAKKFAWAHLDVAGTAAMMGGVDRYATGRPVPLLTQYLINQSHKKII
jgi:leucyl aminopeptidase